MTVNQANIPGCILSGGEARRLGGKGKAFIEVSGKPMIKIIIQKLQNQVFQIGINTREKNTLLDNNYVHIEDSFKEAGGAGPLAGISSSIKWAKELHKSNQNIQYVLTVPVDCPFLPNDLVNILIEPLNEHAYDVVVASSNGNIHPVIALWSLKLDKLLDKALLSGVRKIDEFTKDFNIKVVNWDYQNLDPFFNINNFEDLILANNHFKC